MRGQEKNLWTVYALRIIVDPSCVAQLLQVTYVHFYSPPHILTTPQPGGYSTFVGDRKFRSGMTQVPHFLGELPIMQKVGSLTSIGYITKAACKYLKKQNLKTKTAL